MINVNQITSQLAKMADPMLQKYAAMHKNDPYTVALALAESNRRKEMRSAAQGAQGGAQPKVVDQMVAQMSEVDPMGNVTGALPEDTGIGKLPAPNLKKMAGGGIVAFDEGGEVPRYQNKGTTEGADGPEQYRAYAMQKAESMGLDPVWVDRILQHESQYNPNAVSPTGATGIGQLVKKTANHYMRKAGHLGLQDKFDPEIRKDPYKNIDASLAYMVDLKQKYKGDPRLMAVGYNQGETYLNNHLKANEGKLNPAALKDEPKNYLQKTVEQFIPSAEAATTDKTKAASSAPAASAAAPKQDRAWYDRYRDLMTSGEGQRAMLQGVQDVPAALLGAPVDLSYMIANAMGRKEIPGEKPMLGSKYLKDKFTALGIREADSTNPDLQNIRSATEGVATLYNPLDKATKTAKMSKEGIASLAAENKAAAANSSVRGAQEAGATVDEQNYLANMSNARRDALAAESPTKAAAIQKANELAAARSAPVAKSMNPVGEASLLANADIGMDPTAATAVAAAQPNTDKAPGLDTDAIKALQDKAAGSDKAAATEAGGLSGLFNDPAFLMGMRMMSSQNPRFLGAAGEAGIGTAGDLAARRKAAAEEKYYGAKGAEAQATADLYNRGAKDRSMALEAEKLVQQHMEKWGSSAAGQLAGLKGTGGAQAEETRVRNAIYQQLGISPTMGAAPAANTSGFKMLGVR